MSIRICFNVYPLVIFVINQKVFDPHSMQSDFYFDGVLTSCILKIEPAISVESVPLFSRQLAYVNLTVICNFFCERKIVLALA